jgi:hypothetical protein
MYGTATPDVARAGICRVFRVSAIRRVAYGGGQRRRSEVYPTRFGLVLINQVPIQVTAI